MKVAIATVQVPFINGGAEIMTQGLLDALRAAGHRTEVVTLPFRFGPPAAVRENMDWWQALDFDGFDCGAIDRVVALKFPAFYLRHPEMRVWLMHQHRSVYELFDTPFGERSDHLDSVRFKDEVALRDTKALRAARAVFTISRTVGERLTRFNGIASTPLYQPPHFADQFIAGEDMPYVFCPSRLESLKRQSLLLRAMAHVRPPVYAFFAGEGGQSQELRRLSEELGLQHRVRFLGQIHDQEKIRYYSNSLAVFFGPLHEDYGFVTLEAMLSSKPVITCVDSGGPTEFVVDGQTGRVVAPDEHAVAEAINGLWANRQAAREMGRNGRAHYMSMDISWDSVIDALTC
ncbi:glycosyltransferase family 4 protein [Ideonella sp. BN130291]|uniref:glycosyltransferase family 4 protein n=1 Tax=Ideonella sp. BN130291 TaxID=3112940 RepID=UPI002E25B223|nr:glycosyltransferase family 4 protein [Ideonella sp. BN130291]